MENSKVKGAAEKSGNNSSTDDSTNPSTCTIIAAVICLLFIYLATMIISGGVTYYLYGPRASTFTAKSPEQTQTQPYYEPERLKPPVTTNTTTNFTTPDPSYEGDLDDLIKMEGETVESRLVIPVIPPNTVWPTVIEESAALEEQPVTTSCPILPPNTCAPIYVCGSTTCIPSTDCKGRSDTEMAACPNCTTACPTTTCQPHYRIKPFPDVLHLKESKILDTYPVVDLLNNFPPFSSSRFAVVTKLMEDTVEKWALKSFAIRCDGKESDENTGDDGHTYLTKCSFCNDRYSYIRCIMTNKIIGREDAAEESDTLYYPDRDPKLFQDRANWLTSIIMTSDLIEYNGKVLDKSELNAKLKLAFDEIQKTIRPLWMKTAAGTVCRVCADFNVTMFNRCLDSTRIKYPA